MFTSTLITQLKKRVEAIAKHHNPDTDVSDIVNSFARIVLESTDLDTIHVEGVMLFKDIFKSSKY